MTNPGSPFHDPFTTGLAPTRMQEHGSGHADAGSGKRGVQTPAELKALRAASLAKVSEDLQRMMRARAR
ncbi:hypothetical protein ACFYLX_07890 [Pseudarthrobacter enclensis]|jgi:hypothetical protein|uniref:hypothetical protein n=1 Tax=Pseudarthrobacter enclensis TaxID=993070 RepID=UPI001E6F42F4|nr:hypothetical protein NtRootA9_03360 [Arthrobacter sp. NtRootA9]